MWFSSLWFFCSWSSLLSLYVLLSPFYLFPPLCSCCGEVAWDSFPLLRRCAAPQESRDCFQKWVVWRKAGGLHMRKSEPQDPIPQLPSPSWLWCFCFLQSTAVIENVAKSFWPQLPLQFPPWASIEWLVHSRHSKPVSHFTNVCGNYCASLPRQVSPPCLCFCPWFLPRPPFVQCSDGFQLHLYADLVSSSLQELCSFNGILNI